MSDFQDPSLPNVPHAQSRRARISLVWLIPVVAIAIGGYLAWRTLSQRGPMITITFQSAAGLTAGQTKVLYKAVVLGTVEDIRLSKGMHRVLVKARMRRAATPYLTDQARFWVVRPRLSAGSISGLETIVSGAYIGFDPGIGHGKVREEFAGLEQPPAVRSDEPGRNFTLIARRLGSISPGAPVFYRDIKVGEVLNYDLGDGTGPVHVQIFVRAPYDKFVQQDSRFWNVSGFSVEIGASGVHVEVASLQAVLSGGVGFSAPDGAKGKPAHDGSTFPLYTDYDDAQNAGFTSKLPFETFFTSNVRGLGVGAPVEFLGIQVGIVTAITLDLNAGKGTAKSRVRFDVEPGRIGQHLEPGGASPETVAKRLVARGLRAQLSSGNLLTGSLVLSLDFVPGAAPATVQRDGKAIVLPSQGGGLDSILASVSNIATKLDRLPLDQIAGHLNDTLAAASGAANGLRDLTKNANAGLSPALRRLPAIASGLEGTITRLNRTLASVGRSYGAQSHFSRELDRAMMEVGDTARSIRQLADFLDRHPEALIRGRAEYGAGR